MKTAVKVKKNETVTVAKTAKHIKTMEKGFNGEARHYELSVPLNGSTHVVVSAIPSAFDTGLPETYIFPANAEGKIVGWGELDGSFRGGFDHVKALKGAGYEVTE